MRIYNGWILRKGDRDWIVYGRNTIRNTHWILLKSGDDKRSIRHADVVSGLQTGVITYQGNA